MEVLYKPIIDLILSGEIKLETEHKSHSIKQFGKTVDLEIVQKFRLDSNLYKKLCKEYNIEA